MSTVILEGRDLTFDYPGPLRAVDGVDLTLEEGEVLALIGPNGSGKTTLIKLLAGILRPASGIVSVFGSPLSELSSRERARKVAVVPQTLEAIPEIEVEAFCLGGRYAHLAPFSRASERDRSAVRRALEEADAAEFAGRGMTELSGGQRQRVLIARALAQESLGLLIDEPTNSLDPEHQIRVFETIVRLRESGRGAVVVTHDLNLAARYATRMVLLHEGRVRKAGSVDDVLRKEVLEPVYGDYLVFGRMGERSFVLSAPPRDEGT